ncbi:hypothetical protein PS6_011572 [Mucor atramentarius]
MFECALSNEHKHLSHSLILNIKDKRWYEYFSPAEIEEIRNYRPVDLPPVPQELDTYLNELKSVPSKDLYYAKLVSQELPLESSSKWAQDSFYNCIQLLKSGFFPITNVSESVLVKRLWSCLDASFDFSDIKCISGEKSSQSSADALNANSRNILSRQSCGRKMDYLFVTKGQVELGCGE